MTKRCTIEKVKVMFGQPYKVTYPPQSMPLKRGGGFYVNLFFHLLLEDIVLLKQVIVNKVINALILSTTTIVVSAYILPEFGTDVSYAAFMAVSLIVSCATYEMYTQIAGLLADLEGNRYTEYLLTLPLPSTVILLKMAVIWSLNSIIMSCMSFFACKVLLLRHVDFSMISFPKMFIALIFTNSFFSFFTLWGASFTKSILTLDTMYMRLFDPLYYLGGYHCSWKIMYKISPILAYCNLLNPYLYAFEGMRAAMLGGENFLPFGLSMGVLACATLFFGAWGIRRLKKRLDFI